MYINPRHCKHKHINIQPNIFAIILISFASILNLSSQSQLSNPSFEDTPADATMPTGWFAQTEGTTPDILPGYWGVYNEASEGETYIGLITRPNGTFESIGQRLYSPLIRSRCYKFSIDVAKSNTYAGYADSVKLRIWLGTKKRDRRQLIFETQAISHEEWRTYNIEINAEFDATYLIIEVNPVNSKIPQSGNILLDNIKNFYHCDRA